MRDPSHLQKETTRAVYILTGGDIGTPRGHVSDDRAKWILSPSTNDEPIRRQLALAGVDKVRLASVVGLFL